MAWYGADQSRPPGGRVDATRRDSGSGPGMHRFVIDFVGDALAALAPVAPVRAKVSVAGGKRAADIVEQIVAKNPVTGGWRLTFQVRPLRNEPLELRAFLAKKDDVLTETWSYVVLP
jgi:glucans biosynthesis protein